MYTTLILAHPEDGSCVGNLYVQPADVVSVESAGVSQMIIGQKAPPVARVTIRVAGQRLVQGKAADIALQLESEAVRT